MLAAWDNDILEVINLLLDNDADGSLKGNGGKTVFDYAKENEKVNGTEAYWRLNDGQFE